MDTLNKPATAQRSQTTFSKTVPQGTGREVLTGKIDRVNTPVSTPDMREPTAKELSFVYVRDLDETEAVVSRSAVPAPGTVMRLGDEHHELARLFACGITLAEVSRRTGREQSELQRLKRSPAFAVLVAQYQQHRTQALMSLQAQLNMVSEDALSEAHKRILAGTLDDKSMTTLTLGLLDRSGYSPVKKQVNINADYGEVEEAKRRAEELNDGRVERVTRRKAPQGAEPLEIEGSSEPVDGSNDREAA